MRVAVIGVGSMGKNHKRVYKTLGCEVVVYDPRLPEHNNFDEFLKQDFSHVSICSPTKYHVEQALTILNEKPDVKVLVEKPISHSLLQAKELIKYSDRVCVGHIERFNPAVQALIEYGVRKFHTIKFTRINNVPSRELQDVAVDLMVHDADLANYLLSKCLDFNINKTSTDNDGIVDCATMQAMFGKTHAYFESSWVSPVKQRTIEFTSDVGYGKVDLVNQTVKLVGHDCREFDVHVDEGEPLVAELATFIEEDHSYGELCSVEDAIKALEMVL